MNLETIRTALLTGQAREVQGYRVSATWAVTECGGPGGRWRVTHIPTGCCVGPATDKSESRIAFAEKLAKVWDSDKGAKFGPQAVTGMPPEKLTAARKLAGEERG